MSELYRFIHAERVNSPCTDGSSFAGSCRLAMTLLDARRCPADRLVHLCRERREHENAYHAVRHTILRGRVLRSHDPAGVGQEMRALPTLYLLPRRTMVEAAESQPGSGDIGRRVLSALSPARRTRVSTRKVKSPVSRCARNGSWTDAPTAARP